MSLPAAADLAAWATNVVASVGIVMVNKQLMGKSGAAFDSAVMLCAAHFTLTAVFARVLKSFKSEKDKQKEETAKAAREGKPALTCLDIALFSFTSNFSIICLNSSLMINTVALYQLAKLAIPPFTAAVEATFFGKSFTAQQMLAMLATLFGVGLVSIAEFNIAGSVFGLGAAMGSIVGSGMQQILVSHYQKKYEMSSNDLLAAVTPWQGASLFLFGPFLDRAFTGKWVIDYVWTRSAVFWAATSCTMAVVVNASHFMCLGRFTAVSYQIMGFTKTIAVLFIGYFFFGGVLSGQQMLGTLLCMTGMVWYAWIVSRPKPAAATAATPSPTSKPRSPEAPALNAGNRK